MKKVIGIVGSMKTMAILMLIFAVSIGYATFIENDYGTPTAQAVVYKAAWFEALLIILAINLVINIFRFKMIQQKKILILMFHVSFLVILFGAAITRFYGFEGTMHIREGQSTNLLTSSDTYLKAVFTDKEGKKSQFKQQFLLSKMSENHFDKTVDLTPYRSRLCVQSISMTEKLLRSSCWNTFQMRCTRSRKILTANRSSI